MKVGGIIVLLIVQLVMLSIYKLNLSAQAMAFWFYITLTLFQLVAFYVIFTYQDADFKRKKTKREYVLKTVLKNWLFIGIWFFAFQLYGANHPDYMKVFGVLVDVQYWGQWIGFVLIVVSVVYDIRKYKLDPLISS